MALCFLSEDARAQQRAIINPSFEANDPQGPGTPNWQIFSNGQVPGWDSTTGEIELWDSNFSGVPSHHGQVHAEMNANTGGALYQTICLVSGESVGWTFAHRNRSGGPATQTARFQIATTGGSVIQTLATQATTNTNAWTVNTGSATYSGPSGMQRVQFTTSDAGSYGNLLDDIRINLNPFVEFSTAATAGVESVPTANLPRLIVSGGLFTARTVTVTITGGTATLGSDYTTPSGNATFTVTIPAGIYESTAIPLGISILEDSISEGSETIQMSLVSGSGYTIAGTQTCGGAPISSTTYTITDNDSPVVLTKNWVNGRAGDAASLTITGGSSATAGSSTVGGSASNAAATATSGQTITVTEAFTTGSAANYIATVECRRNDNNNMLSLGGSGLSRSFTMPSSTSVTCAFTNTRRSATLTLRKTWANAKVGDLTTVSTTGLTNNASLASVANSINETDSLTPVTVYAAEVATIGEIFSIGAAANYDATLACTGTGASVSGMVLTIGSAPGAITCTLTNSRRSAQLHLRKTWIAANQWDGVYVPITSGFTNNIELNYVQVTDASGNQTNIGPTGTVYAGDTGILFAEQFSAANPASYNATLSCTGGTLSGTNARQNNTLTINGSDGGTTVVCTYTNSRLTPLTVSKTSMVISDGVSVTNPMAIPGATIRYCILITNPGNSVATGVTASDPLPAGVTFVSGSMRSGTSCAGATTFEDDNATGADESDPFGMSRSAGTVTGVAPSLAAGGTFAMVFHATVN